ncbi:2OG-Fe(II) oxygenase, putative [Bodo saltans]|uniref:2OG-Fe(II) oxygenase, putative n=1 Tax=Bodo saltans TaxID=75058 RepID=A0A0S4IWU2_BODSA|nr:2OG-Fe(II) oxygenase, putative [Bodo saltans]|eukprot:CUG06408.1 2OG-Fe(II) oxygenase, putative [Bodo saltans]
MKKIVHVAKHLWKGGSLAYLAGDDPYQPFGPEFGLTIFPNYVQTHEQAELRKGYVDVYTRRSASIRQSDGRFQLPPLPVSSFEKLIQRMEQDDVVPSGHLNNQTANLYEPGDFIRAHLDNLFVYDDIFAIASMGANALMKFVHVQNGEELEVMIPDNSVYVMSGPSRYVYFHMVLPVEAQRFSIVFRRSILNSDGGFRPVTTPFSGILPLRSTQVLNALYSRQVGAVRVKVDDEFMQKNDIGAFDTAKWVKSLRPLRDWSLLSQVDEDEARIEELRAKRFLDTDLSWRVKELRKNYKFMEEHLSLSSPLK